MNEVTAHREKEASNPFRTFLDCHDSRRRLDSKLTSRHVFGSTAAELVCTPHFDYGLAGSTLV